MYTLKRLEENKSREGNDEVFFAIRIKDDLGEYNYGHWLNKEEMKLYEENKDNLTAIIEANLERARNNYEESLNAVEPEEEELGE